MTDKKYLETVFNKFVESNYTKEELRDLLDSFKNERDKAYLMQLVEQHLGKDFTAVDNREVKEVTARVMEKLKEHNRLDDDKAIPHVLPRRLVGFAKIAAAIAVIFVISFVGVYFYQANSDEPVAASWAVSADVAPGGNKARLVLSDGREIALDDAEMGALVQESGISISKAADGQLVYEIENIEEPVASNALHTIRTPRGGQYRVDLPDGTKVWLNSASSLTYPVHFASTGSRRVKIEGEAYFEVAKSVDGSGKRIPFMVDCPDQTVEVLGTHFNVNTYMDEASVKTTLLEGSVRLHLKENGNSALLRPGEQGKVTDGRIVVSQVDLESVIDWKHGDFVFANEDLRSIMRKISRWYDVDIQYSENLTVDNFEGRVSRSKKLSEVLKVLAISADIDLRLADGTVWVKSQSERSNVN